MAYKSKFKGKEIDDKLDLVQKLSEDISDIKEDIKNIIQEETDPVFSNSPAADITDQDKTAWNNKQDNIEDLEDIRKGAAKGATAVQPASVVTAVTINGVDKTISSNKINVGTVVTGITMNGSAKIVSNGNVNLGTVITAHQDISGKQDKLVSGTNIKTVMGKSLLGSGNVSISGSEITSIPAINIVAPTGVKYKSNDVWTIYSSQVPYHRANRLAFLEDDEFLFETSTDSGSTWTALSKNDDQRKVFIGENKGHVSFPSNPSNRVRVTLTPKTTRYFMADWFYIWASVPYASPAPTTVDIEYSTGSAPDTWLTYATNIPIEGQTGPNMIWYGKLMGSGTSNKNVRFTFKNNNNSSVNIQIKGIEAHGIKSWADINTMARTDRIYSVGVDKSATFPGSINCTKVNISGDTIATQKTLKTINGQSLIGSGDIAPSGYERKLTFSPGQTCRLAVDNKHMLTNILSGQLIIQLPTTNPTSDNYTKECGITFTTGSTAPTIIFSGNIWWVNGTAPTIDANCVYEFSFKFNFANNTWLGVYASFKTE